MMFEVRTSVYVNINLQWSVAINRAKKFVKFQRPCSCYHLEAVAKLRYVHSDAQSDARWLPAVYTSDLIEVGCPALFAPSESRFAAPVPLP